MVFVLQSGLWHLDSKVVIVFVLQINDDICGAN